MPVNLNTLAATLPGNNYKLDSAIGGAVSGMQIADYLDNRERGTRYDDLEYSQKLNQVNNEMADNPQKELARKLSMSKTGAEQEMYDSGLAQQEMQAKAKDAIATVEQKEGTRGLQRLVEQSDYWDEVYKAHKAGTLQDQAAVFQKHGAALGLPPINLNDPNLGKKLQAHFDAAVVTRKLAGELVKQRQMQTWTGTQNDNKNATALAVAQARNTGGPKMSSNPDYNVINQVRYKAEQGEPVTEHDILRISVANENRFKATAGDSLMSRSKLEQDWILNKNNKKDRPADHALYSTAQDYAEAKIKSERAERLAEQAISQLSGAPLVVQGQIVGTIGDDTRDVIKAIVNKQPIGGTTNAKDSGSVGANPGQVKSSAGQAAGPAGPSATVTPLSEAHLTSTLEQISKRLGTTEPTKLLEALKKAKQTDVTKALIKRLETPKKEEKKQTQNVKAAGGGPVASGPITQGLAQVLDQTRPVPPGIRGDEGVVVSDQERALRGY